MTVLALLPAAAPASRPLCGPRRLTAVRFLLLAGSAIFAAAFMVGAVLIGLDRLTPAASAGFGALACAGAAMLHGGLALACVQEWRRG